METKPNFFSKHTKRIEQFIVDLEKNELKCGLYAIITEQPTFLFKNLPTIEQLFQHHLPGKSIKNQLLLIGNTEFMSTQYPSLFSDQLIVQEDFTDITEDGRKLNATYQIFDDAKPSYFIDFPAYSHYRSATKTIDIKELRSMLLAYKNQKKVDVICIESLDSISCNNFDSSLSDALDSKQKERYRYEYLISKLHFFARLFDVKILFPVHHAAINFEDTNTIKHLKYINDTVDYLDNIILLTDDGNWEFIKKNGRFEY